MITGSSHSTQRGWCKDRVKSVSVVPCTLKLDHAVQQRDGWKVVFNIVSDDYHTHVRMVELLINRENN